MLVNLKRVIYNRLQITEFGLAPELTLAECEA